MVKKLNAAAAKPAFTPMQPESFVLQNGIPVHLWHKPELPLVSLRSLFGLPPVAPDEQHCFGDGSDTDHAFAIRRQLGDGSVVGLGDNRVLTNEYLRFADNSGLAVALLAPTDGGRVVMLLGDDALRKLGSVGRASGCEARIVDSAAQPVADGVTGEIAIRGPNVMRGYYKNAEATAAAFTADGWLRTGDLGHRDADGFFFVTGRIKELIIKGGENIAPREIDEALLQHPAVLDAAAVGIPDKHYGQEILACIVLREGAACAEDALREFCIAKLGRYKTPKTFRFVTELPRGPSGKVQRLKLVDLAG